MEHLPEHEHAFIDINNVCVNIFSFELKSHDDHVMFQTFCESFGYKAAVCCCAYGKPYMGDTWDETNKVWIETAKRQNDPTVEE